MKRVYIILISGLMMSGFSKTGYAAETSNPSIILLNTGEAENTEIDAAEQEASAPLEPEPKWLKIKQEIHEPGGRGYAVIKEKINLLSRDYISTDTFEEHIAEDHARGLPWILALITYFEKVTTNGKESDRRARAYADGRHWHRFLTSTNPTLHPAYKGNLKPSAKYYAIEMRDGKWVGKFLGKEKDITLNTPKGKMLGNLLSSRQGGQEWNFIGNYYLNRKDFDQAIGWYEKALSVLPTESDLYGTVLRNIAANYTKQKDWRMAITWYKKAVCAADNKKLIYCMNWLANCYYQLGKYDKSIVHRLQAIAIAKKESRSYREALVDLGFTYQAKSDWRNALDSFELAYAQISEGHDDFCKILEQMPLCYFHLGEFDNAIAWYEKALPVLQQKQKNVGMVLHHLAHTYDRKKNFSKAIEYFELALSALEREKKDCGETLESIGKRYRLIDRTDKAIEYFKRAFSALKNEKKRHGNLLVWIGHCYKELGAIDMAIEWYEKATSRLRKENEAYGHVFNNIAFCYVDRGELVTAKELHEKALERLLVEFADDEGCGTSIGRALEGLGDVSQACTFYLRSMERPDQVFALTNLLYVYAIYKNDCDQITEEAIKGYAQRFADISHNDCSLIDYKHRFPLRYATVCSQVEKLLGIAVHVQALEVPSSSSSVPVLPTPAPTLISAPPSAPCCSTDQPPVVQVEEAQAPVAETSKPRSKKKSKKHWKFWKKR